MFLLLMMFLVLPFLLFLLVCFCIFVRTSTGSSAIFCFGIVPSIAQALPMKLIANVTATTTMVMMIKMTMVICQQMTWLAPILTTATASARAVLAVPTSPFHALSWASCLLVGHRLCYHAPHSPSSRSILPPLAPLHSIALYTAPD